MMATEVVETMKTSGSPSGQRRSDKLSSASSSRSSGNALIRRAGRGSKSSVGSLLEHYRIYLVVLAPTQIEKRLQPRVSPSDVVQETMLRAHKNFAQFRGNNAPALLAS